LSSERSIVKSGAVKETVANGDRRIVESITRWVDPVCVGDFAAPTYRRELCHASAASNRIAIMRRP
jgi:hypothetical protein